MRSKPPPRSSANPDFNPVAELRRLLGEQNSISNEHVPRDIEKLFGQKNGAFEKLLEGVSSKEQLETVFGILKSRLPKKD